MQRRDSHKGQQRRRGKVEGCSSISHPCFSYEYSGVRSRKKKKHVTELRVTNEVTVCDQKHKSNTLPVEVALCGSSKTSKPAAPTWSDTVQCSTHPHQTANQLTAESQTTNTSKSTTSKKGDIFLPVEASNHTQCLSARAPNEDAGVECGNSRTSW